MMINKILKAASAKDIPEGDSGLWFIRKRTIEKDTMSTHRDKYIMCPKGTYTYLYRITMEKMHNGAPGEIVMEDTPLELKTHFEFILKAKGNILISGLGLGCVVRGLLIKSDVEHIICIEDSQDVLNLVAPYMPKERLTIIHADALEWTKKNKDRFDFAYHDLWTCREEGEPHLAQWHAECLMNCRDQINHFQFAWDFPKPIKRYLQQIGVSVI